MMNYYQHSEQSFTLVETMVAIALLSMAMLAPFYSAHESLTASEVARDRLTASMLAEESIEYVQQIRDNNFLATNGTGGEDYLAGLDGNGSSNCISPHFCRVDATLPAPTGIIQCQDTGCTVHLYTNSQYQYTLTPTGNTKTIYLRYIQLTKISQTEVEITSTVTWTDHAVNSTPSTLTLTEYLTNWQ